MTCVVLVGTEAEGQDRKNLMLPGHQEDILAAAIAAKSKATKLIVLLFNAGGLVGSFGAGVDAIVAAGFPGQSAGLGIADALSGKKSIAGRLAVTWPRALSQVPPIADYRLFAMHKSTYRYSQPDPLFAFGAGLSYSTIAYSKPKLKRGTIAPCESAELSVTVTNVGAHATDEVILVFAEWAHAPNPTQDRQLVTFHRVSELPVTSAATVSLHVEARDLATLQVPGVGARKSSWMSGGVSVHLFVGPNQPKEGARSTLVLAISGPACELSGCPKALEHSMSQQLLSPRFPTLKDHRERNVGSVPVKADDDDPFDWIRKIAAGPPGSKVQLEAKTYLIDKQYQLPQGTELRGVGTTGQRTEIKAVGGKYNACAGTASAPGLVQGRKGLLLGDDTYVSGLHLIGMESKRLDCLYAMLETPGCTNSEGNFPAPPNETGPCGPAGRNLNCCGGYTGNDGHGVRNATVEDVTVQGYTTQNMFFMAPTAASKRVSRDVTVRNMRMNGSWAGKKTRICYSVLRFYSILSILADS